MAEKTNVPRLNMRYGMLLTSEDAGKKIKQIILPEFDQKFFILKAENLQGENSLKFSDSSMPIMAEDAIMYPEQPILAVIAPDYESATLASRLIKVESGEEVELTQDAQRQEDYGWGNIDDYRQGWKEVIKKEIKEEKKEEKREEKKEGEEGKEGESKEEEKKEPKYTEEIVMHEYRKVETTFSLDPIKYKSPSFFTATCWIDGAYLHVMVPTQYPRLVLDTVQRTTLFDRKKIIIHSIDYYEVHDEYLLYPAIVASIAASATVALKCPVEIKARAINRRGEVTTTRTTYLSPDLKIVAEDVVHTMDMGAYFMLEKEAMRHAMTAVIPNYNLQAFKASVKAVTTFNFPSFIFSSMGYSEALAATEHHSSVLGTKLGLSPYEFRLFAMRDKRKFTDYLPATPLAPIKDLLTKVAMKSSFARKWSSNESSHSSSALLGYTKGVGISSAIGIAGFSTTFSNSEDYKAKITLTQRGAVVVETSAYSRGNAISFWKKIVKKEMNLQSEENVLFPNADLNNINTGPKVLSRFMCSFSKQLEMSARKLKSLQENEKPPIAITFNAENHYFPCEFDESAFGSMVIEVQLSSTSLVPEIKEVWAEYSVGIVSNMEILESSVKQLIMRTVKENGMKIGSKAKLNINITRRDSDSIASIASLTRALVISSLTSALEQAIGNKISLPLSTNDVLSLRRSGN